MRGLLADVNVQGHIGYLERLIQHLRLAELLDGIQFATFPDLGLSRHLDDRTLWEFCQREGWVLFTENRNRDEVDSLQETIVDSWQMGDLPVLTLANKSAFETSRRYADRVAHDVADVLFGIKHEGRHRDQPRLFIPVR